MLFFGVCGWGVGGYSHYLAARGHIIPYVCLGVSYPECCRNPIYTNK